jgi:hypothetical protein
MAEKQVPLIPGTEHLRALRGIAPGLPVLVVQVLDREHHREFIYAAMGLGIAALGLVLVLGGFVYLVMQGHSTDAKILLGAGVLGLIAGFIRARLRSQA